MNSDQCHAYKVVRLKAMSPHWLFTLCRRRAQLALDSFRGVAAAAGLLRVVPVLGVVESVVIICDLVAIVIQGVG